MDCSISLYQSTELKELCEFLNRCWEFDSITPQILDEKLHGDPAWQEDLALMVRNENRIIGFMQGVIRDIRGIRYGYIKLLGIDPTFRRKGIATYLYKELEKKFVHQSVDAVRIYDVPLNYWMPGIDPRYTPALCWAMRNGFKRFGDTSNLKVNLSANWDTLDEETKLATDGIVIRGAFPEDKQDVLDFIQDEWALWGNEVEMAFKDDPPSMHIALIDNTIKAFSAHNGNNKGTGWFGPMGTHPDLRGKGIGAVLLKRCLNDMKFMGLSYAVIPWVGPIDFYAWHANAQVDRVFWRFEKKLHLNES